MINLFQLLSFAHPADRLSVWAAMPQCCSCTGDVASFTTAQKARVKEERKEKKGTKGKIN
jgi:hypothetical protein